MAGGNRKPLYVSTLQGFLLLGTFSHFKNRGRNRGRISKIFEVEIGN
jgi:hypothetical protein